jgi:probable addiction module antidote protein
MAIKTVPFDPAEFLDTEEAQATYLDEAFATGDKSFIADALGVVARARRKKHRATKPAED